MGWELTCCYPNLNEGADKFYPTRNCPCTHLAVKYIVLLKSNLITNPSDCKLHKFIFTLYKKN